MSRQGVSGDGAVSRLEVVEFERGPLHELESALRRCRGRSASEGEGEEVGGLIGVDTRDEVIQSGDVVGCTSN